MDDSQSHTSDADNFILVDEADVSSEPSQSSCGSEGKDIAKELPEIDNQKHASRQLLSNAKASASQTKILSTITASSRQYQPSVRLKRLDPAALRRLTANKKSEPHVPVQGRKAKNRCLHFWHISIV